MLSDPELLDDVKCLLIDVRRVCLDGHQVVGSTLRSMTECPVYVDTTDRCGQSFYSGYLIGEEGEDVIGVLERVREALDHES